MRISIGLSAVVAALAGVFGVGSAPAAATAPLPLLVPQATAFAVLGYDCGGIKEHAYATGFDTSIDPAAGYPTGDVFLTTTCSAGGRGGNTFTVTAWTSDTWDLTGALLSHSVLAGAPAVDAALRTAQKQATADQLQGTPTFIIQRPPAVARQLPVPGLDPASFVAALSAALQ